MQRRQLLSRVYGAFGPSSERSVGMRIFTKSNSAIADAINDKLDETWQTEFSAEDHVYVPLYFQSPQKCDLMFVGINPSFVARSLQKILDQVDPGLGIVEEYFAWSNRQNFDIAVSLRVDEIARESYPYFKHFRDLSSELRASWSHLDMYQHRHTKQHKLKDVISKRPNWAEAQLQCFEQALAAHSPRIIVVANAEASNRFIDRFGSDFDDRLGFHHTRLNGRKVPTFFSGMLTGQRALDTYNRERLIWHIKRAWK
jgi:hypothetical protein